MYTNIYYQYCAIDTRHFMLSYQYKIPICNVLENNRLFVIVDVRFCIRVGLMKLARTTTVVVNGGIAMINNQTQ